MLNASAPIALLDRVAHTEHIAWVSPTLCFRVVLPTNHEAPVRIACARLDDAIADSSRRIDQVVQRDYIPILGARAEFIRDKRSSYAEPGEAGLAGQELLTGKTRLVKPEAAHA